MASCQEQINRKSCFVTEHILKRLQTYQSTALATLIYADWVPQVNGLPGALLSKSVDHSLLCQHRYFVDSSDLEEAETSSGCVQLFVAM